MYLSKEQILGAADLKFEVVKVPEWGGEVRIRSMTGTDRDAFETSMYLSKGDDEKANMRNLRARMVAYSVVDDADKRIFDETDIETLGAKSARALDRVYAATVKLNAITADNVEELTKN